jgi:hypothetical protein
MILASAMLASSCKSQGISDVTGGSRSKGTGRVAIYSYDTGVKEFKLSGKMSLKHGDTVHTISNPQSKKPILFPVVAGNSQHKLVAVKMGLSSDNGRVFFVMDRCLDYKDGSDETFTVNSDDPICQSSEKK